MSSALMPGREELEQRARSSELRPLADELRAALIADNPPRIGHAAHGALLRALSDPRVRFVITGQQLGVYGGPLLTLYKALHAIKLARALSGPDTPPVVPLFWLQAEDHDLEEIASVTLPASLPAGDLPPEIPLTKRIGFDLAHWVGDERRRSVGVLQLPPETTDLSAEITAQLPAREGQNWLAGALSDAYRSGNTLTAAFRQLLDEILGEEAILYLNPMLPAVRRAAAPIHRRALERYLPVAETLMKGALGAQVHVRPRSLLFFLHPEGATGPRFRIEADAEGEFHAVGTGMQVKVEELEAAIEAANGSISASALLRPVIQDSILPSVCYIGGQAEVKYFEQVALVAPLLGAPEPKIVPRARFVLIDAKAMRLQRQLELGIDDLLQPLELVQSLVLSRQLGESTAEIFARMRAELDAALFAPKATLAKLDGEAEALLQRTKDKISRAVDGLEERIAKSSAAAFSRDAGRVRRLHALLRPDDLPQERVFAAVWFAAQVGPHLATLLLERLDPFAAGDNEVKVEL